MSLPMPNKPDQGGVSGASDRRAKVPRELILHTMGCCTEPEHVGEYVYPTIAQEQIADSLLLELRAQKEREHE